MTARTSNCLVSVIRGRSLNSNPKAAPLSDPPTTRKRRWPKMIFALLILAVVVLTIVYVIAKRTATGDIAQQLNALELGRHQLGSVSVGINGIVASDIEFFRDDEGDAPWLTVDQLTVEHPIIELVRGAKNYNAIKLAGIKANIDTASFTSSGNQPMDWSQLELPAKNFQLTDVQIALVTDGKPSLSVTGIDLQLKQTKQDPLSAASIFGRIGDFLGNEIDVAGDLDIGGEQLNLTFAAETFAIATQQWKSLPGLPESIDANVTVDGQLNTLHCDLTISDGEIVVDGSGQISDLAVGLPRFDLPISVSQGAIHFDSKQVKLTELEATLSDQGQLRGQAETSFDKFPILVTFDTKLKNVSSESLRKLVPAVPEILAARVSGPASGSVSIERSTRTTVNLNANAVGTNGIYGEIEASQIGADVSVQNLVFDDRQNFDSIAGIVKATATFDRQPIVDVLKTFELDSFQQQMQFAGNGSGQMKLALPLATAEDLGSWKIKINGDVPTGSAGGQGFANANVNVDMIDGILNFNPIKLSAVSKNNPPPNAGLNDSSNLEIGVRWPIALEPDKLAQASVAISGTQIPADWASGFLQNQINGAAGPTNPVVTQNSASAIAGFDQLTGAIDFKTTITLPTASPDDVLQWQVNGTVGNSQVSVGEDQLRDLAGVVRMSNGQLLLENLKGNFYKQSTRNGSFGGSAKVDLRELAQTSVDLDFKRLPLPWLVAATKEALPQYAEQLPQRPVDSLTGKVDVNVAYRPSNAAGQSPLLKLTASAKEISVSGQTLRDFNLDGSFDDQYFKILKLTSRIGTSGKVDATGDWSFKTSQANGKLHWKRIPLATLGALSESWPTAVAGTSTGQLTVLPTTDPVDLANEVGYQVAGSVGLKDLQFKQFKARNVEFDVVTDDGSLLLQNFRNASGKLPIDLDGRVGLTSPYKFAASGKAEKLQLSQLLTNFTPDAQIEAASLTGVLQGGFSVSGQVESFSWQTSGNVVCVHPTYNGIQLEDIKTNWTLPEDRSLRSNVTVEVFGGTVEMLQLLPEKEAVRVQMKDIDVKQLATVFEVPSKFVGRINGEASLKNWSFPKERQVEFKASGDSISVGAAELGDLQLEVNYQNETVDYELAGAFFGGNLAAKGDTSLQQANQAGFKLPLKISLTNAKLAGLKLVESSSALRALTGRLSVRADARLGIDGTLTADGRFAVDQAKWNNKLVSRLASVHFKLTDDRIVLDDLDVDLKRGAIAGQATLPLAGGSAGRYEIAVRNLDLEQLAKLFSDDVKAKGLLDGRLSGQIGRRITGKGFVGVRRASVNGVAGQSLRLPIQFQHSPKSGTGKLELRRSTFRIFDGNASGKAAITFGNSLDVDVDMNFSNVDTEKMLAEITGIKQADQGKLTGRLQLTGHGVRSSRNLKGSFRGSLQRVSAFELPVLSDIARLLSVSNLQSNAFDSDAIELLLNNNQVTVKQFNFSSPLVKIAITGQAYLDGRLDLSAAARVENLQQPALLDELAGSPLAKLNVSPLAAVSRVTEFLSERIAFLKIGGNFKRPQVRIDSSQQLPAEVIRFFLPRSNILPSLTGQDN